MDTCSTISSIRNNNIVQSIQPCDAGQELRAYTNGKHRDYYHTATLKMLPFKYFCMYNQLQTYSPLHKWRPISGPPSTLNWTHSSTYTFTVAQGYYLSNYGQVYTILTQKKILLQKTKPYTTHYSTQEIVTSHAFSDKISKERKKQ